ncbi:MAG: hypothetical protein JXM79_07875 [Sedimentisphaerales bacterium]|nr:hypothetical protein [Sedimentisphaerales bacterium]
MVAARLFQKEMPNKALHRKQSSGDLQRYMQMTILSLIKYIWAFPATILGLILILFALMQEGSASIVDGVIEAHGGIITKILKNGFPMLGKAATFTLGHIILGCDFQCLSKSRKHKRIHVKQYELWGPFFIPSYLVASFFIFIKGGNPYGDNPFEKKATNKTVGNT